MNYKPLQDYVEKSELRIVNDDFRVRLSSELAAKYDAGEYDFCIRRHVENMRKINALGIVYPLSANPVLYMYIVPRGGGALLNLPSGATSGGRPVACFDLDGFPRAYGMTEEMMTRTALNDLTDIGNIHELAHFVHYMFYTGERWLCEGIAEAFPYYLMDYENIDAKHRALIAGMTESDILDARTLAYEFDKHADYSKRAQISPAYVSSYLLVRGILKHIEKIYGCGKVAAMQRLMMFVRGVDSARDFFIWEVADFIGAAREELHFGKSAQLSARDEIAGRAARQGMA
jgi:hypothetical protein